MSTFTSPDKLWNYGRNKLVWFSTKHSQQGSSDLDEMIVFSSWTSTIGKIMQQNGDKDNKKRIYRWNYSLGAIITDRQTFINRSSNYETFWMEINRMHGINNRQNTASLKYT